MPDPLYQHLNQYFGLTSFRPLQEEIIRDILSGNDVFVLMPTGGGKSLCFQLPAVMRRGLTIVVSPLISLMKDQVDGLVQNGIKAAFLNSSLSSDKQQEVKRQIQRGELSLLYIAPERLAQLSFLDELKTVKINLIAIDEAHCLSEWGHDFRPEYRKLSILRNEFPTIPIIALTATATSRVKEDIINHLQLNNPKAYQASFNRANLSYRVEEKHGTFKQIVDFIHGHPGQSGIIYCSSRENVDSIAGRLQAFDLMALPYHAGLDEQTRAKNQEQFIHEDVDIMVATVAFGMGIDKPNVRFVIHYDLPANLERYYQETGRAGRDGLSSECLLFYSFADTHTIQYFIDQKTDLHEQEIARWQLKQVLNFARSRECRRKVLLRYFDEEWPKENCASCDNCLGNFETFDATILAQKILSCVYRLQERFGINYVIEVLTGSTSSKVLANGHDKLSTYKLVTEYSEIQLKQIIRELIDLAYLALSEGQYPTIKLTPKGWIVLKNKEQVFLRLLKETKAVKVTTSFEQSVDTALFQKLRLVRKRLAEESNLPPYIIFSDLTLKEMASLFPQTKEQFGMIRGVGKQKLESYADNFLPEIIAYCLENNLSFKGKVNNHKTVPPHPPSKVSTVVESMQLYRQGLSVAEIAKKRGLTEETIHEHLIQAFMHGESIAVDSIVPLAKQQTIMQAFHTYGFDRLAPIKSNLGDDYSYSDLRWVKAKMQLENPD